MIVNKQKDISFINNCMCIVDFGELKRAILWFAKKPVCKFKHIYMYGRYPAVSIYDQKIHVHRLLVMYWLGRELEKDEAIHHKDGNRLNSKKENLETMWDYEHAYLHNKGKKLTKIHRNKISKANRKRKGMKYKKFYENKE